MTDEIPRLYFSIGEVAKLLGCSYSYVNYQVERLRLRPRLGKHIKLTRHDIDAINGHIAFQMIWRTKGGVKDIQNSVCE